jgi:hypothetical protein
MPPHDSGPDELFSCLLLAGQMLRREYAGAVLQAAAQYGISLVGNYGHRLEGHYVREFL